MGKDNQQVSGRKLRILGRHNPLYTLLFVSLIASLTVDHVEVYRRGGIVDIPESISCHPL